MQIDEGVSRMFAEIRVIEFSTITRSGGLNTRPMASAWHPGTQQIVLTTPLAYAQKVHNVRGNARVSLLFSDYTGSGIPEGPSVLVQGAALAPNIAAAPQDLTDYWSSLLRKDPHLLEETADQEYRSAMAWYYWRLPIFVAPERVVPLQQVPAGGEWDPPAPEGAPMREQIADALSRYPSAVFVGRDRLGYPYATRAMVSPSAGTPTLTVRTAEPFRGEPGAANLLWHRHNGRSAEMSVLLVAGTTSGAGTEWSFVPERLPGALASGHGASSYAEWAADARSRSLAYLERHGLTAPAVDWAALSRLAPA